MTRQPLIALNMAHYLQTQRDEADSMIEEMACPDRRPATDQTQAAARR